MSKVAPREQVCKYLCSQFSLPVEQVNALLPGFIATLASHMVNVENALVAGELKALGKTAHTMKGALLNLGMTDGAELAQQIETHGKAGDHTVNYAVLVAELRQSLAGLIH